MGKLWQCQRCKAYSYDGDHSHCANCISAEINAKRAAQRVGHRQERDTLSDLTLAELEFLIERTQAYLDDYDCISQREWALAKAIEDKLDAMVEVLDA